jgi:hypothetical protein
VDAIYQTRIKKLGPLQRAMFAPLKGVVRRRLGSPNVMCQLTLWLRI